MRDFVGVLPPTTESLIKLLNKVGDCVRLDLLANGKVDKV